MTTIIADIYEAAMLPEFWPRALQNLCNEIGVEGATLITIDDTARWTCSLGMGDNVRRYLDEGWHARNEPMEKLLRLGSPGFVRDIDLFTIEEVKNIPIIRDFKQPGGFGWGAAMATPMPTGETLLVSVEQLWARGPLDDVAIARLEDIRPHLSRAALLAAKLQHQRAEAAVNGLELAGVPAALVSHAGKAIAVNRQFSQFSGQLFIGAHNKLRVTMPRAAELLDTALARLAIDRGDDTPMSIAIPATEETSPLILHVLPTKGRARDIFGPLTALLVVTNIAERSVPPASLLRALFDLTPRESRIAEALLHGAEKAELRQKINVSDETVRTHVKSILRKTGLKRRVDLVRLLSGIVSI